jgi:hypothetical protein
MKRIVGATCLAVMWALTIASPVDAGKTRHKQSARCDVAHGHVVIADSQAIVYRSVEAFEPSVVYACSFTHPHIYERGPCQGDGSCGSLGCLSVEREALAGTYVAYAYFLVLGEEKDREETFLVIVRDLRNGRILYKIPTGTPRPQNASSVVGAGPVRTLVLKSDGSVAWINEHPLGLLGDETDYEVHALDKTGSRILASGTDIDPRSLALAGSTLYWMQGGKPFFTRLG